jgi:hypothetical protein
VPGPLAADEGADPARFFERFPRFVETSETGPWLDRLNARYLALVHANRHLVDGATVLDLASHDGRFTFAALCNGAARVIGIEHDAKLVGAAHEHMEHYGISRDRYDFLLGDMFERIPEAGRCDVVFCFGILYHINDHMRLLSAIAEREPRTVIVDTNVSLMPGVVVEVRAPLAGNPPPPGAQLEGWPTKGALDAMLASLGWTFEYFDWLGSGLAAAEKMDDYRAGRRVSAVVTGSERVAPEVRAAAVQEVFDLQDDLRTQWMTIIAIAAKHSMTPQALAVWVREAERHREEDL